MSNRIRTCPQCGEPIEGRPNKKYCNETCKGQYFRENAIPVESFTAKVMLHQSEEEVPIEEEDEQEEANDDLPTIVENTWQRLNREAETKRKVQEHQQTATELHEQFCQIVKEFLTAEGQQLAGKNVSEFLDRLDELTDLYRQHPYLKQANSSAQRRLNELYSIQDTLQEITQGIARKALWKSKLGSYELTSKWRKQLRNLLIAD